QRNNVSRSDPSRSTPSRRRAKAPKGIEAAARVATNHSVLNPADRAAPRASRARRLRPTPDGPASTRLPGPGRTMAAATSASASSRPMRGQAAGLCGTAAADDERENTIVPPPFSLSPPDGTDRTVNEVSTSPPEPERIRKRPGREVEILPHRSDGCPGIYGEQPLGDVDGSFTAPSVSSKTDLRWPSGRRRRYGCSASPRAGGTPAV